jgi:hypothetical protein
MRRLHQLVLGATFAIAAAAQVHSPKVLLKNQPDASDLGKLARGIYASAGAKTPREQAEAIWRFFLTDGRFVKPGFWYHIAGWAYEEPIGEVLDPLKLLNSYGFGLCYHIAPLLEAVWKAGGFDDARVWFLTGHTVAEVFYDGRYHYYDSDMMGYNTAGHGPVRELPVASVHQIEADGNIMLSKLKSPTQVDARLVEEPWYPADVREAAVGDLAKLFTTTGDNWLFPFERAPQGHSMDFELRLGERLVRYFQPEGDRYYLPYKFTGQAWEEFPQEVAQYQIKTANGPRSQKDVRRWATGRLEYRLPMTGEATTVYEVRSPYVIIDAQFEFDAVLASALQTLTVATSTDDGRTWLTAGLLGGPHRGRWQVEPAVLTRSEHGRRTAISGSYGYLLKVTTDNGLELRGGTLLTRIQLNPRILPELAPGRNNLIYTAGAALGRHTVAIDTPAARNVAHTVLNARYVSANGQGFWIADAAGPADFIFRLRTPDAAPMAGFDAGGRFLDLSDGLAPDKFTAEVRRVAAVPANHPAASIAWSKSPVGPFQTIWEYDPRLKWRDGVPIDRTLRWPEVDRRVEVAGAHEIYVRYRIRDLALDHFRLATETKGPAGSSPLELTHIWREDGAVQKFTQRIPAGATELNYSIDIPAGAKVVNEAVIFECQR